MGIPSICARGSQGRGYIWGRFVGRVVGVASVVRPCSADEGTFESGGDVPEVSAS